MTSACNFHLLISPFWDNLFKHLFRIPQFCLHDLQAKYLIQLRLASQKASTMLYVTPFYSLKKDIRKFLAMMIRNFAAYF